MKNLKDLLNKPVVFIGMPGTGKSTVGRKLAKRIDWPFYDTDEEIKRREGYDASDVFYFRGEKYFRNIEDKVVREIIAYGNVVLSTGSGTFTEDPIREFILQNTLCIWLDAKLEVLLERVSRRDTRPELTGSNKEEALEKLNSERLEFYKQAHLRIDCGDQDPYFLLDIIIHKISEHISGNPTGESAM